MIGSSRRLALLGALLAAALLAACGGNDGNGATITDPGDSIGSSSPTAATTPSCTPPAAGQDNFCAKVTLQNGANGLQYGDFKVGDGAVAENGDQLSMQYTGWLQSTGVQFDSSRTRGQPFQFTLGGGQVIKGWDQGILGMKVGGRRRLVIPASLGYGASGQPPTIPANATLVFDVELLAVTLASPSPGAATPTPS